MPIGLSTASVTHHRVIHQFGGNLEADSTRNLPGGLKQQALSWETLASYRIARASSEPPHEKLTCSLRRQSLHILPAWEPCSSLPSSLQLFFFSTVSHFLPSLHLPTFSLLARYSIRSARLLCIASLRISASKTTAVCFMLNTDSSYTGRFSMSTSDIERVM